MLPRLLSAAPIALGMFLCGCGLESLDPYFTCAQGGADCAAPSGLGGAANGGGSSAGDSAVSGASAAGTGGQACTVTVECAPGTCWRGACGPALELDYRDTPDADSDPSDAKWIKFEFTLTNRSPTTVSLSSIELRYYFTAENVNPELQVLSTTDVPKSEHDVLGSFAQTANGWTYLALTFRATAGDLPAGAQSGTVKVGVHDLDFGAGTFYQLDDYSYLKPAQITVYLAGARVGGAEPSAPPAP